MAETEDAGPVRRTLRRDELFVLREVPPPDSTCPQRNAPSDFGPGTPSWSAFARTRRAWD
jgi:hypothetical protein